MKITAIFLSFTMVFSLMGCGTSEVQNLESTVPANGTEEIIISNEAEASHGERTLENADVLPDVTEGTEEFRGFQMDNVLHSEGDATFTIISMCRILMTEMGLMHFMSRCLDMEAYIFRA